MQEMPSVPPVASKTAPAPANTKNDPAPKRKIPLWLIVLFVLGFWISGMATVGIIVLGQREEKTQDVIEQTIGIVPTELPTANGSTQQSGPSTTPPPQSVAGLMYPYASPFGFQIEYPVGWRQEAIPNGVMMYEAQAKSWELPRPYNYGRVIIQAEEQATADVVAWFDARYAADPENAPVKRKLYTNKNQAQVLETNTKDSQMGRLKYFFIANGYAISVSMNITDEESINKQLQKTYGTIIDSIKITSAQ